jgi:hypothetical protein
MNRRVGIWSFAALACMTLLVMATMGLAARTAKYQRVPENEVNAQQRDRARAIASDILTGWREGKYVPFPDDFDEEVKKISTPEAQKKAADEIKKLFGDYQGLQYAETDTSKLLPGMVFYRFKGTFTGAKESTEVLVTFDGTGKITGFWVKPWEKDVH